MHEAIKAENTSALPGQKAKRSYRIEKKYRTCDTGQKQHHSFLRRAYLDHRENSIHRTATYTRHKEPWT